MKENDCSSMFSDFRRPTALNNKMNFFIESYDDNVINLSNKENETYLNLYH